MADYKYVRKSVYYEGRQYWVRGKTEAEALQKLGALKAELKRGTVGITPSMTVRAWADEWLDTYIRPKVRAPGSPKLRNTMSQKSFQMYRDKLDGYILPAIGSLRMKDVKDVHLQKILNGQAGRSKSHLDKLRIVLQAMFRQARISRLIQYDPSEAITTPAATVGHGRSLTAAERKAFHAVSATHRCGLMMRTLLGTGIRPGELAPLLVKDFDLNADVPIVHIYKSIESGTFVIGDPKTESGFRDIPLPADLIDSLRHAFAKRSPFDIAFPQTDGVSMKTQTCLSNDWRSFRRQMNLLLGAKTTPHGKIVEDCVPDWDLKLYHLRHTYCTDLQAKGVPINIAKYLMGHADITTTANIYTHSDTNTISLAAALINPVAPPTKTAEL